MFLQTGSMFALAKSRNLVLLEAFHYRFHPAVKRVKEILSSGELGAIKSLEVTLEPPAGLFGQEDIRYNYSLGGGSLMDTGCYTVNAVRYLISASLTLPETGSVLSASSIPAKDPRVDESTVAHLSFPSSVSGSIKCSLARPRKFGILPLPDISFTVKLEGGTVEMSNFVMPTLYHSITITSRDKPTQVEKVYKYANGTKGEDWWSTYRFQLEAFVDRVHGKEPATWISEEDSIANMAWIEAIYDKTGLGSRPASVYKASSEGNWPGL
jgi:predicted dehydrogenase